MGLFISFEGVDGSGKSSQLQLLSESLRNSGHDVVTTREPGGTVLAEALRESILHLDVELSPETELLLFAAARAQHVVEVIGPALRRGQWVLCDRFIDSTVAYQGAGLALDETFICSLNRFATGGLTPDLTVLLDVPPQIAASRLNAAANDRIERRDQHFHRRVREAFLMQAAAEPRRFAVVDGTASLEGIHQTILNLVALRQQAGGQRS